MNYEQILQKQKQYESKKHLISKLALEKEEIAFKIEFTHNSTAIEGNTMTLMQTKLLLEDKISIGDKSLRETYEIVNNNKAFEFAQQCIVEGKPLSEKIVKDIHAIINENIFVGGIYRNEPVKITGASHKPPHGQKMFEQIKSFFADLEFRQDLNPIELAAWTHAEFVRIHPFIDGNGRTSRLIMNYQLMAYGYPPVSISVKDRFNYYECLDKYASENELEDFSQMIANLVENRLDELLELT
ncbi:MAG: Fic family protein [Clostridia bacterium]